MNKHIKITLLIFFQILSGSLQQNMQMPPPPNGGTAGLMSMTSGGTKCSTTNGSYTWSITEVTDNAKGSITGFPGGYRQITTSGCPGYDWTSQTTPNSATEQKKVIKLPISPKLTTKVYNVGIKNADGSTNSNPTKGPIGVAINGVSIYGNADANNGDAYISEGKTFDTCGGHPQNKGDYHYHLEPNSGCTTFGDTAGKHSPLFGLMYDGIPIFGQLGDNGLPPADLDACGGHTDKTYPYYHYHLPNKKVFPYILTCLKGCIYNSNNNVMIISAVVSTLTCSLDSTQFDYSALKSKFPTGVSNNVQAYVSGTTQAASASTSTSSTSLKSSFFLSMSGLMLLIFLYLLY